MKIKSILSNIIFGIQILLVFLLFFENKVIIPPILQPLGRMHPLILHFPVVLIVLLFVFQFTRKFLEEKSAELLHISLVYATVIATSLTAIMGFFLSMEGGYAGDTLIFHKWTGVTLSFLSYGMLITQSQKKWFAGFITTCMIVVLVNGHLGASLTHGENFLLEPLMSKNSSFDIDQSVFSGTILPILNSKCSNCHNPQKRKGELDLSNWESLQLGGKNGELFIPGNLSESHLINRVYLPFDEKEHMPPKGKPQLTPIEISILEKWIESGADPSVTYSSLDEEDSLLLMSKNYWEEENKIKLGPTYDFAMADPDKIASLNSPFRTVSQPTQNSPALDVQIFVRQAYKKEFLAELEQISEQIVFLNLSYLPLQDDELYLLAKFPNLEKLILNYTDITNASFAYLSQLPALKVLAVAGTKVDLGIEPYLKDFTALTDLHLWDTGFSDEQITELQDQYQTIYFDAGYIPDKDLTLLISSPQLANKTNIISKEDFVEFNHSIADTRIFYTLDGSEPDSNSIEYIKPILLKETSTVRTRAYKKGWQPSQVADFPFYIKGFNPKKAYLLKAANQKYSGDGPSTLIDNLKGDIESFQTPRWLGYQDDNFDALFDFGESAPKVEHVVLSYGRNILSYIMKPVKVEVYGGNSRNDLKLLRRIDVDPDSKYEPNWEAGIDVPTGGTNYRYYRTVAYPLRKLPEWHIGAGDKGWVFVDELFFY